MQERPSSRYSCGDEKSRIKQVDQQRISIDGISITQVGKIYGAYDDKEPQTLLRYMLTLFDAACVAETASALISDYCYFEDDVHNLEEFGQSLQSSCREFLEIDLTENLVEDLLGERSRGEWFGRNYHLTTRGQPLFCSSQGSLGLGPEEMQEGDNIVVLFGGEDANLSFILRPFGENWKLVGPCYMYDLKDGSAVKKWRESGEPAETYIIC